MAKVGLRFPLVTGGGGGTSNEIQQLDADPVSPSPEEVWVLKRTTGVSAALSHTLLHYGLTMPGGASLTTRYELKYRTLEGSTIWLYRSPIIETQSTNASNVGTAETDLHSQSINAGEYFVNNGDNVSAEAWGIATASGPNVKMYFNGTVIGNFTLTSFTASSWKIVAKIVRISSTQVWSIVECAAEVNIFNAVQFTNITGLDLTTTKVIKTTATGSASNDVTEKYLQTRFESF